MTEHWPHAAEVMLLVLDELRLAALVIDGSIIPEDAVKVGNAIRVVVPPKDLALDRYGALKGPLEATYLGEALDDLSELETSGGVLVGVLEDIDDGMKMEEKVEDRLDGVTDGVLERVVDGMLEGVIDAVLDGVVDGVLEGVVRGVTEGVTDGVTEGVTDGVLGGVVEDVIEGVLDSVLDDVLDNSTVKEALVVSVGVAGVTPLVVLC